MDFNKKIKLSYIITLILTVLSAITLLISFRWCFNSADGYFVTSAPTVIFGILYIAGILFSLAVTLSFDKNQIIKTKNEINKTQIPFIIIACFLAIIVLFGNLLFDSEIIMLGNVGIYALVIYLLFCSLKSGYRPSWLKILLLYVAILFPLSMEIINSANYTRHVNSIENKLSTVFEACFMLYILYEAKRIHTGEHSRWHFGTMLLTLHSGFSLSSAYVVAYLIKSVDEPVRFWQMLLTLLISVLVGVELLRFIKSAETHTNEEWAELEDRGEIEGIEQEQNQIE